MKAYKVESGTKVIVTDNNIKTPPGSLPIETGDEITIYRLDGMYCNGINNNGDRIYIAALTDVKIQK